jgi:NDP-sugar pyrophosphorylase family protein
MDVVILSGGLGTRIAQVFDGPKGLAMVQGRPVVAHVIDWCLRANPERVVVAAGYRGPELKAAVAALYGTRVEVAIEDRPLGTAGCLYPMFPYLSDPFAVVNGDTLVAGDFAGLWAYHRGIGAQVTVGVFRSRREDVAQLHIASVPGIVSGIGRPQGGQDIWANAGVYAISHNVLKRAAVSLEHDVLPHVAKARRLHAYPMQKVYDIGTPDRLKGVDQHWPVELTNQVR